MSLVTEQHTSEDDIRKNNEAIARVRALHPGEFVAVDAWTRKVLAHKPSLEKVTDAVRAATKNEVTFVYKFGGQEVETPRGRGFVDVISPA